MFWVCHTGQIGAAVVMTLEELREQSLPLVRRPELLRISRQLVLGTACFCVGLGLAMLLVASGRLGNRPELELVPAGAAFLAVAGLALYEDWRSERPAQVVRHGELVDAVVVVAEDAIRKSGSRDVPCLAFVTFDRAISTSFLLNLAEMARALRGTRPANPGLAEVAAIVGEKAHRFYRRRRLPESFTRGTVVYAADLCLYRSRLRNGILEGDRVPCFAEPGDRGGIEQVPDIFFAEAFPQARDTASAQGRERA